MIEHQSPELSESDPRVGPPSTAPPPGPQPPDPPSTAPAPTAPTPTAPPPPTTPFTAPPPGSPATAPPPPSPPAPAPPSAAPPPPPAPPRPPRHTGDEGFDLVAALMRWVGPAFIVLGMIYGAVYLVETDMFGPPERLVAGIAVTLGFGWLGQYFIRRGQRLLGELVTGTFFAGAFLCSWAVPAVTGWPVGTSILLSGAVGLLALAYSWARADSTTFAVGVVGLAGIPISGPLYSDHRFVDTVLDVYGEQQMIVPLVLFAGLALGLRLAKGWFLPWALTIAALFISYTITSASPTGFVALASFIAATALLGVVRGEVDDASPVQKLLDPAFRLLDAGAPLFALAPIWMLAEELGWSVLTERLVMGGWAVLTVGLALTLYRGVEAWQIAANPGRRIGAFLSAFFAGLIAIGSLNWYVYVTVLAAAFLVSVVAGSPGVYTSDEHEDTGNRVSGAGAGVSTTLVDLIQAILGTATALGLLLIIMTGLDGPLTDDVPMLLSAWSAVALFAAAFYVRPELRAVWGVPFAFALGLLAASLGGEPVTLLVTSAVWLLAGFAVVRFGLARRQRTPLMIGLTTMAVAVAKFLLVDTPHFEGNLMRAVSFLVAGLVIVLVSADSNDIRAVLQSSRSDDPG